MEELNIKPKYWKDLIDDTPFTRKDIIHLQDPLNLEVGNLLPCCLGAVLQHLPSRLRLSPWQHSRGTSLLDGVHEHQRGNGTGQDHGVLWP